MVRKQVSLSQAIEGYFIAAQARRLSPATLADYGYTFKLFTEFLAEDPALAEITADDIRAFLRSRDGVSKKTLRTTGRVCRRCGHGLSRRAWSRCTSCGRCGGQSQNRRLSYHTRRRTCGRC
jgi:hypothetical protein